MRFGNLMEHKTRLCTGYWIRRKQKRRLETRRMREKLKSYKIKCWKTKEEEVTYRAAAYSERPRKKPE
jgi:hypothetical protein